MSAIEIRLATPADIPEVAAFRRAMFVDMGETDNSAVDAMATAFESWAHEKMERGNYVAWLAEADGKPVASVGLWLMEWSPVPHDLSQRHGRVMDVYTDPDYRRRGLARLLMTRLLDWSRTHKLKLLHLDASAMGRGLYEELGFEAVNEMRLRLD